MTEKKQANKKIKKDTARQIALEVICAVIDGGAYANIALNKTLRTKKTDDRDRRFITELVYGTIKAKGTLDWLLSQLSARPLAKIDKVILNILRMGLYQIFYLDKVPASAACNAKAASHAGAAKFVNGILRSAVRGREAGTLLFSDKSADAALNLALTKLHPLWLVKHWLKQFGEEETEKLLDYNNLPPVLSLRTNTLKTTRSSLLEVLQTAGFEAAPSKWCEEGIICTKTAGLSALMEKAPDAFYMQDESSMLVAHAVCPQPGMTVLDLCAAPGGKTTHIAQLMQNKGRIYACDIHPHKMELIKENAVRLGIDIIEPVLMDASVFKPEWADSADCVLVDAPCSGFGVLRRRAEARWRKNKKDLKVFPPLQKAILQNAARYVKPGGRLVYSTCTLEQAENNLLVSEFLKANTEFEYAGFRHPLTGETINELQLLPQRDNVDGFYICVMRRKEL
jgi:16S rRNA (cytosine967-C5)-methyltransferase